MTFFPCEHTETVTDVAVLPTCTSDGLSTGVHCTVCNKVLIAQNAIPTGHTWSEWSMIAAADCFFEGEESRSCEVCTEIENRTLSTLEHEFVQDEESGLYSCEL